MAFYEKDYTRHVSMFLILLCFPLCTSNAQESEGNVNPIQIPIIKTRHFVHTKFFAQIPGEQDGPARILAMIPFKKDIFVVSFTNIHRVRPNGTAELFMNVRRAIWIGSRRRRHLSVEQRVHAGVRSIAFDPSDRKRFYISAMETRPRDPTQFKYISDVPDHTNADSVLIEFRMNDDDVPIFESYRCVFRVGMPKLDHTIRQIVFRKNLLYIAHGDGSEQAASFGGGQNSDARGKILRINPRQKGKLSYTIPRSNPFVGDSSMLGEVWALGFRNPHHLCFDRFGVLFVADTGRSNVEEVNVVFPGGNYGWSLREGTFKHTGARLINGIKPLPSDDKKFNFTYPAAQVGHEGPINSGFIGQAIAGACPVQNGSPMKGRYYYSDFPISGKLFFSFLGELKRARTRGNPSKLSQARTRQAQICYDHDNNPNTPPVRLQTLGDVVRYDPIFKDLPRVDIRFGQGKGGELYWSSKRNGRVYVFTSSLRKNAKRGPC